MKIQKLEPSKHKEGRWLVWFEDGSLLRVGEGDIVALSLYGGKELSDEETAELEAASRRSSLSERAVELLSARAMSRKELEDKLSTPVRKRKKAGEECKAPDPEVLASQREQLRAAAAQVADRMEELGLINDEEYAAAVARHYSVKGYGVRKVQDELYRRGVPREYWEQALAQLKEEGGAGDQLDELIRKKLRGEELTRENLKKTSDYLARRGFGWEEISAAMRRYGAELEE